MHIQIKDVDLTLPQDTNVFIIHTYGLDEDLYISRHRIGQERSSYTSPDKGDALIYFNRQAAESALNSDFKFVHLPWRITAVPINSHAKADAKQRDSVLKKIKAEKRREREAERNAERND